MWRFQGNACVLAVLARARRSRSARMVDAGRGCSVLVVSTLAHKRCRGCKINAVHVSLQLRSLTDPLPVECYRRYAEHAADTWHCWRNRGPDGILRAAGLTHPHGSSPPVPGICGLLSGYPKCGAKSFGGRRFIAHDCTALQARTVPQPQWHNPNKCDARPAAASGDE